MQSDPLQSVFKPILNYDTTLLAFLQSIFSDVSIYNNERIKKLVLSHPKGFVPIRNIIDLPQFKSFAQHNPGANINISQIIKCISEQSKKLITANYQIRRIQPFVDNISNKNLTMIYIENLPASSSIEMMYGLLQSIVGTVYKVYYKSFQNWAFIFIANYQILEAVKDQLYLDNKKIVVKNPQESLFIYGDKQKIDSDYYCMRIYLNKNIYDFNGKCKYLPKIQNAQGEDNQQEQDQQDMDQMREFQERKPYQLIQDSQNYKSIHDIRQLKHRKTEMEFERQKKIIKQRILYFDNSRLLALRNTGSIQGQVQ